MGLNCRNMGMITRGARKVMSTLKLAMNSQASSAALAWV